jgi:hypothetical protein
MGSFCTKQEEDCAPRRYHTSWSNSEQFIPWLSAIRSNDVKYLSEVLETATKDEKEHLLNGRHTNVRDDLGCHTWCFPHLCERPLVAAVLYSSYDAALFMLNEGANPLATESNGDNVAHAIVALASAFPKTEDVQLRNFVRFMELIPRETRRELLYAENGFHLRPLEYAASTGCIKLFKEIFQTPDVYLTKQLNYGLHIYEEYNITDYDNGRAHKSPLLFFCISDEETMRKEEFKAIMEWAPIKQWKASKIRSERVVIFLWFALRLWYCFVYHTIKSSQMISEGGVPHVDDDNVTVSPTNNTFTYCSGAEPPYFIQNIRPAFIIYGIFHSILTILVDAIEVGLTLKRSKPFLSLITRRFSNRHILMPQIAFRIVEHIGTWGVLVYYLAVLGHITMRNNFWISLMSLVTNMGLFSTLLYILLLIKVTGYHAHVISQMFLDVLYFSLFVFLCSFPFAHFYMTFVNTNTVAGCIEDFNGFWRSMYTMFLVMLNIRDMTEYDVTNETAFVIGHVLVSINLGILMLNFLIACMTTRMTNMAEYKDILVILNRLFVFMYVETRLKHVAQWRLRVIKRRYMKVANDGRTYLINIKGVDNI